MKVRSNNRTVVLLTMQRVNPVVIRKFLAGDRVVNEGKLYFKVVDLFMALA